MSKMLHNKHFKILEQFLEDYNKEIYGRQLVNKVPLSQKSIALTLDKLEKLGNLKSRKQGPIKYFRLNLNNLGIKDIIIATEINKKIEFFKKNRKIANLFKKDDMVVGIFGSYPKETQTKDSDLDVFIVGKRDNKYEKQGKLFDINISIKYFIEKEFIRLIKEKNNLIKEIIKNHIIMFNTEKFVNLIWSNYYGFD